MRRKQGKNHGFSNTRLYATWCGIKARCNNPKEKAYKYYGGKGIKIYPEWEFDFLNFKKWAEHTGYNDSLTIERKDVNKDYCPDNCNWITKEAQQRNKSNTLYYEYFGFNMRLKDWAKIYNLNYLLLYRRLKKGWDFEKAINTPVDKNKWNNVYKEKGVAYERVNGI